MLTREEPSVVVVPADALMNVVGLNKVFVIADGKAQERQVRPGARQGATLEILQGVKAGEAWPPRTCPALYNGAPSRSSTPRPASHVGFLEVFVRRPGLHHHGLASLVVLGLASFAQLGVDIFPKVDLPTITITTRLPGASPEEIESQITKTIEEAVNTIAGLDELRSSSIEGQSQVFATFVLERNVQEAANDVREKVSAVVARFPPGTETPIIEKADPDSAPVMAVVVSGPALPARDHRDRRQADQAPAGDGARTWAPSPSWGARSARSRSSSTPTGSPATA